MRNFNGKIPDDNRETCELLLNDPKIGGDDVIED